MDLKDHDKPRTCCKQPNITARYCVTNAGRLFVKNVNPFDTVGGNAGDVKVTVPNRRKNEEFVSIFDKTPSKESNKMLHNELVNESLANYSFNNNYNEHMFMNEQYDALLGGNHTSYSQPMVSMSANAFNAQYSSCSRDLIRTPRCDHKFDFDDFNRDDNRHGAFSSGEMFSDHHNNNIADENERCENNTCRRPTSNMYNQEVVYKIMQRNAKLQKIVRKLVIEREREKQREAWNNYINDLKNKHRYYSNEPSRISPQYVPGDHNTPEMIDDFYNLRFNWRQSSPCQNLLADLYGGHDDMPSTTHNRFLQNCDSSIIPPDLGSFIYDNDRFCYPTCSQSNMLRLNKERQGYAYNWRTRPAGRNFRGCGVVDNNRQCGFDRIQSTAGSYPHVSAHMRKPRGAPIPIQTANLPLVNEEDCKELNASKAEFSLNDKNNLHYTEATSSVPGNTLNQNQDITVPPLKQEYLKRLVHDDDPFTAKIIKLDKDVNLTTRQYLSSNKLKPFKNKLVENTCDIQKSYKYDDDVDDLQDQRCFDEKFKNVTDNIIKLKQKILQSEENTKLKSLANIEEKIDGLMKSMNSIMTEIQTKKNTLLSGKSTAVSACKMVTASRTILNRHSSDPYSYKNKEYVCAMVQHSSRSLTISGLVPTELKKHEETSISKMEEIFLEEMKKSDKAKSDIEEILNLHEERSCSLQITFDVPTKERSTEVTDSVSIATLNSDNKALMKQIPVPDQRVVTIAVNTDPLGWLALLRVSTQTVMRLLSFVPNLNYYSYLSLLPPLLPTRRCQPHYTCNICGATFCQPSQLSNHVKQHNLGKTRDCCVCRHALDLKSARAALFTCRHCGQRFTRAYCCELHQQSCARQLGRSNDVTSSHMLLQ